MSCSPIGVKMSACVRIERMANGYEVEINDPKIVAENQKPNSRWRDPQVSFSFNKIEDLLEFLKKSLEKALPLDEFESAFIKALVEDKDN